MAKLSSLLTQLVEYKKITDAVKSGRTPAFAVGLSNIHKAHFICTIVGDLGKSGIVITPDEATAVKLCEDINAVFGQTMAMHYPARDFTFREVEGASKEYENARLAVLLKKAKGECSVVVASAEAASQYTVPKDILLEKTMLLKTGGSIKIDDLVQFLVGAGYQRRDEVDGVCQFSIRGGIVDFYPPEASDPYRIEFWGDEIDTISAFKADTQRRFENIDSIRLSPAREVLYDNPVQLADELAEAAKRLKGKNSEQAKEHILKDAEKLKAGLSLLNIDKYMPFIYKSPATLFDYIDDGLLIMCEPVSAREAMKNQSYQQQEDIKILLEEGVLFKGCDTFSIDFTDIIAHMCRKSCIVLDTFARSIPDVPSRELVNINAVQTASWGGELDVLKEDLAGYKYRGFAVVVLAGTQRGAMALESDLMRDGIDVIHLASAQRLGEGKVYISEGSLSAGMEYPDIRLAVITHSKTQTAKPKPKKAVKKGEQLRSLSDLVPGDYVVHTAHGIGVFEGIVKKEIQGIAKDYIKIRYAGTDTLFVPVTQLDLVSKYIGAREEGGVKLNKLNSIEWTKTRQRVKKAVADMAAELIKLYAERMQAKGFAFSPDNDWQKNFEERFEYDETDDQLRCIAEIKADMERPTPMERLLCGDVGFGKTEVAVRAAFKCVMDSKQCAVLVPTTILAYQHYQTFRKRFEGFPVNIELLSRFRTPKQQEEIVKQLRRGEIDIIIGTHRLVQKDIVFKDLGLCIIDEEQRFGVAHKEKFKEMRRNVDALMLSATPIPRTLNMAMSGIRDMSTIEEAPQDRHPVQTYVLEHDWGIIAEAIRKELRRGGQVFYLHNRVDSIDSCAYKIGQLVPEAKIVTAHGRMSEEQLSDVWRRLIDHEIDILVCTTIIETGVDVANCNTLIIEDADKMGLSQLYQLRGRVGRSSRRAFAYLTFTRGKMLTDIATKRLSAIREFTSFGSGFRIAMRDLEIRGAGSILGSQQHGHMEAVGYDMYLRLLSEAVSEQRGEPVKQAAECMVDIRIAAHIPEKYIWNLSQRIDVYKKIASVQSQEDAMDVIDELIDRFGEPPAAVKGLVDVALVRNTAAQLGITEIRERDDSIILYLTQINLQNASNLASRLKGRVLVNAGAKPYISVKMKKG
ncbi:MAG TPA: transcription-repair coupling factor, partial [Ruminococcaceae bacterium]|nr:transcription-repair coupling factor [Oscillospiraceae bacterium]